MNESTVAVLGAGSWGTALAIQIASNGCKVKLWSHDPPHIKQLQKDHCNTKYLPGILFPDNLLPSDDLSQVLTNTRDVFIVVPSFAFTEVITTAKPWLTSQSRIAWGTKGLDPITSDPLHITVEKLLGDIALAVIAGPSIALEVAKGLPTAVTVAANNIAFAKDISHFLSNKTFRVYTSSDIVGVEICGAVKNVLAIAAGITDGLQLGANALSALVTRGLVEMTRLGTALGGKATTFMGLAGVGDLILTCTSNQSRNRRFGMAIASGLSVEQAKQTIGQAVEGFYNLKLVYHLAQLHKVSMPITECVYRVVYEGFSANSAMSTLLERSLKSEDVF